MHDCFAILFDLLSLAENGQNLAKEIRDGTRYTFCYGVCPFFLHVFLGGGRCGILSV